MEPVHRSPAQVSAQAAAAMPRWILLLLLLAFILPGLFGRDLWPTDGAGFGRIWSMVHGTSADWLLPNIAGVPAAQGGPLPYWMGAILVYLLGGALGNTNAAAIGNVIWYAVAILATWLAAYRFARRDQAQPVAGAFGGEASRRDYARLIADIATLLTIGTVGLFWRLHQIQTDSAILATSAVAVLAMSLLEWNLNAAVLLAGASCGALALTQGPLAGGALLVGCQIVLWRMHVGASLRLSATLTASALLALAAALVAGAWPVLMFALVPREAPVYFDAWLQVAGLPGRDEASWILRTSAWFLWPLWPLAAWAVYAWRGSLGTAAHLERPLALLGALAVAVVFSAPLDEHMLVCLVPALVPLAAFGATTLRRALDNFIDWFAIAIFTLCILYFWAYYAAMQLGAPRAMAASIAHIAPGFVPSVQTLPVMLAALACAAWAQLIAWRILSRPRVLWRGPMLGAAGVATVWVGINLLYLPAVDYVFSHRVLAAEIGTQLRSRGLGDGCVLAHHLAPAERALIAYYGQVRFVRDGSSEICRFAVQYEARRQSLAEDPPPGFRGLWEPAWDGRRQSRPDERWRIWARLH